MYISQTIRKSLLAKMLTEVLDTQVMVKNGMKHDKNDKALQKPLNSRQLALKLIANVTYRYTSASHTGRIPCTEIADSIVQTGREILQKVVRLIQEDPTQTVSSSTRKAAQKMKPSASGKKSPRG